VVMGVEAIQTGNRDVHMPILIPWTTVLNWPKITTAGDLGMFGVKPIKRAHYMTAENAINKKMAIVK
jgi:hypothetical protein